MNEVFSLPLKAHVYWIALFGCFLLIPQVLLGEFRTWTSVSGTQIEAKVQRQWLDTVYLENRDGNSFQITIRDLSAADQQFLQASRSGPQSSANRATTSRPLPGGPGPVGIVRGDPDVAELMQPGSTIRRTAPGEQKMTYEIYTPNAFDPEAPPPILILFHPGGNGRSMLNHVRESVNHVGWVAVGVNRLANRMEGPVRQMEDEALADIFARVPHNGDRVYLGGFSGGALRAFRITSRYRDRRPFAGVLSYGGWLGGEAGLKATYPGNMAIALVNGDKDEAANHHAGPDKSALSGGGRNVRIFSFGGGHVIAPASVTTEALIWMQSLTNR